MNRTLLVLLSVAFVYQAVTLPVYSFAGIAPDFVLAVLCFIALFAPPARVLISAALAGLVVELFSLDAAGTHSIAYVLAALALLRIRAWRLGGDFLTRSSAVAFSALYANAITHCMLFVLAGDSLLPAWGVVLARAVYDVSMSVVVVELLRPLGASIATPRVAFLQSGG